MPRATDNRPARRLDALLACMRRHGVEKAKAAKLEGVGEGLEFEFGPLPDAPPELRQERRPAHPELEERGQPKFRDELDLVAEGRDGPVPENGVS
jgi:hypothetical protein